MKCPYIVHRVDHCPDEYMRSQQEMDLDYQAYVEYCIAHPYYWAEEHEQRAQGLPLGYTGPRTATAIRTGITSPGYRERAVYRIATGRKSSDSLDWDRHIYEPGYWVYDGGELIESGAWHTDPANREIPAPVPTRRKRVAA